MSKYGKLSKRLAALGAAAVVAAAGLVITVSGPASATAVSATTSGSAVVGQPITLRWVMNDAPAGSGLTTYPQYLEGNPYATTCGVRLQIDTYTPKNQQQADNLNTLISQGKLTSDHPLDGGIPQTWIFEDQAPCETTPPSTSTSTPPPAPTVITFQLRPTPVHCEYEEVYVDLEGGNNNADLEHLTFTVDGTPVAASDFPVTLQFGESKVFTGTVVGNYILDGPEGGTSLTETIRNDGPEEGACAPVPVKIEFLPTPPTCLEPYAYISVQGEIQHVTFDAPELPNLPVVVGPGETKTVIATAVKGKIITLPDGSTSPTYSFTYTNAGTGETCLTTVTETPPTETTTVIPPTVTSIEITTATSVVVVPPTYVAPPVTTTATTTTTVVSQPVAPPAPPAKTSYIPGPAKTGDGDLIASGGSFPVFAVALGVLLVLGCGMFWIASIRRRQPGVGA